MTTTIRKSQTIGTRDVWFSAWEPSALCGPHSTITSNSAGGWLGRIGTRRLTPDLDKLPAMSDERSIAVRKYHEDQYAEAYAAIVAAHPEASDGYRSMGEILVTGIGERR